MATRRRALREFAAGLLVAAVGSVCAPTASAAYSFDADDQYLTPSSSFPRWVELAERHIEQLPQIEACVDDAATCPSTLTGLREVIVAGRDLSPERQMRLANRFINGRRWSIEPRRNDEWRTLEDFLRAGGDCEDFAIAKYFLLRELGFDADALRVAITWDLRTHDYHAVTMVHLDDHVYVLDVDGPPRLSQDNYRFLFSINEIGIWDHTTHTRAPMQQPPRGDIQFLNSPQRGGRSS